MLRTPRRAASSTTPATSSRVALTQVRCIKAVMSCSFWMRSTMRSVESRVLPPAPYVTEQ